MAEKKKPLFKLVPEIQDFAERFDNYVVDGDKIVNPDTGECLDLSIIENLQAEYEEKMKSCIYVYRRFDQQISGIDAQIAYLKGQIKDLEDHKSAVENRKKAFAKYMLYWTEGKSWKAADNSCSCYSRENRVAEIVDESLIPAKYYTIVTEKKFDKKALLNAMQKQGIEVPGAQVVISSISFMTR